MTRIYRCTVKKRVSRLGGCNSLPLFSYKARDRGLVYSDDLRPEDRAGLITDGVTPVLPYMVQDDYDRSQKDGELSVICIENALIKAACYPDFGGRVTSIFDKKEKRELLFDNPVFQPANLAIRNAWINGGIEWNCPVIGHSANTLSPVFAESVTTPQGPLLRIYEFDRLFETVWQVALFLPEKSAKMYAHVKIVNPNDKTLPYYWWTNLGVPMEEGTRVLCPADYAVGHTPSQEIVPVPFPDNYDFDGSYPWKYSNADSLFFRKPGNPRPWIAYVDNTGKGMMYSSTKELVGRKMFVFGTHPGGQQWMDYLSLPGKGNYIEIQGGITHSQLQTRPLGAGQVLEWTECYSPLDMNPDEAHDPDYNGACEKAGQWLDEHVPMNELEEIDTFLKEMSMAPVNEIFSKGAAWGMLEEKKRGKKLSPGLSFEAETGEEEKPWAELLEAGTFSQESLENLPLGWSVSKTWMSVLEGSMEEHGSTWLHHLFLGTAQMEWKEYDKAELNFKKALEKKKNMHAFRDLALLSIIKNDKNKAYDFYKDAWKISDTNRDLACEIFQFLLEHEMDEELNGFLKELPREVAEHERIRVGRAQLALRKREFDTVREILKGSFVMIRECETVLSDLWIELHIREEESRLKRSLYAEEKEKIEKDNPVPDHLDFRMVR